MYSTVHVSDCMSLCICLLCVYVCMCVRTHAAMGLYVFVCVSALPTALKVAARYGQHPRVHGVGDDCFSRALAGSLVLSVLLNMPFVQAVYAYTLAVA